MRSSSVRVVTLVLAGLVLVPASLAHLGCGPGGEPPAPKKLEQASPFERGKPKRERDPNDPIRDPATEVPAGRDGDQVADERIDAILAEAAEFAKIKDIAQERNVLRECANKTPPSARCDGRMGLSMITAKNRRATALYYLREAAIVDDPKADAALYMAIGEQLKTHGNYDHGVLAMEKGVARDPSPENLVALGHQLALIPERVAEGADRIAEARAKDDRIEWLYEEATYRGQVPVREQAEQSLALFKDYIARAESLPAESLPAAPAPLAGRVAELEALRKTYPTQAEYDASKAAGPKPDSQPDAQPDTKPSEPT